MPGMSGFGTTLSGPAPVSGGVLEVVGVRAPGLEASDIDITNMDDADGFKEVIVGLKEAGELTVDLIYEKGNYNNLLGLLGGTNATWTITFPDFAVSASTFVCQGFVKSVGEITIDMDDKMTHPLTIKMSGEPTFTVGT